jgi:hypothetical protein
MSGYFTKTEEHSRDLDLSAQNKNQKVKLLK